jgi:RNA polymerase sigma-70 factor (sigma-E family)
METEIAVSAAGESRLERLYALHIDGAARLAYLMTGDEQQAQDIAQDAFVKIAARFHDLRHEDAFPSYLRTTVLNLSRGHLRRLRTQRDYLRREKGAAAPAAAASELESRDAMWHALRKLPHRQRAAIVLRYYEDLSERQTADALGCSLSAVKSLVSRGLGELRAQMRGDEG